MTPKPPVVIRLGDNVHIDLDRLVNTRLLIQANSGGGKSYLLRRLLEQSHGVIQQIVIDPEGEFASLREKYDYVYAAKTGGDTLADPRTAALLAERLLELNASAIIDIYELNPTDRKRFVRLFLDAMVNAKKELWHPVLVVLDEAHVYCPEKDDAESSEAVKAIATRGRKRGYCIVFATQRIANFAKDAAAECNNKLVGRTSLDVDSKRAAADLGFTSNEQRLGLRDLDDGEFFAYGPAISRVVVKFKTGPIQTTHPKAGSHLAGIVPPPTSKIKKLLPKLSDLPAEAADREKTTADMKKEIAELRRELAHAKRPMQVTEVAREKIVKVKVPIMSSVVARLLANVNRNSAEAVDYLSVFVQSIDKAADRLAKEIERAERLTESSPAQSPPVNALKLKPRSEWPKPEDVAPSRAFDPPDAPTNGDGIREGGQRRILIALAQFGPSSTSRLRVLSGIESMHTFRKYIGQHRANGFIEKGGLPQLTDAGRRIVGDYTPLPTGGALIDYWKRTLTGGKAAIFAYLSEHPTNVFEHEVLQHRAGIESIHTFRKYLGQLRTLELISYQQGGVAVADEFRHV